MEVKSNLTILNRWGYKINWGYFWGYFFSRNKKALENQGLNYEIGADTRSRTEDLLITSQLLYQLSYAGVLGRHIKDRVEFRQLFFSISFLKMLFSIFWR